MIGVARLPNPPDPESFGASGAKALWNQWLGEHLPASEEDPKISIKRLRMAVAASSDLEVVAKRCPSFDAFLRDCSPQ